MMSSLFRWFRSRRGTIVNRAAGRKKTTCKLYVEALEDRTMPSTISGVVFNDLNGDGVRQPGEPGLANWTVFLDGNGTNGVASANGVLDPGEASTATDANGNYSFTGLSASNFDATRVLETGSPSGRWVGTTTSDLVAVVNGTNNVVANFGVQFHPFDKVVPMGSETLVNTTTAGQQGLLQTWSVATTNTIASDANGNYVVVWKSVTDVKARVFNADGTPRTGEITVAAAGTTAGDTQVPMVAMARANNGNFAVTWNSYSSATLHYSVFARVYNSYGAALSGPVVVTASSNNATNIAHGIAMDALGNFVVLYEGARFNGQNENDGITGFQRFNAAGQTLGNNTQVVDAFLINGVSSLAMGNNGNFVVVWDDAVSTHNGIVCTVTAQRYSSAGHTVGSQITVASAPGSNPQIMSSVAMNGAGQFVVAWDSGSAGRMVQVFTAAGAGVGSPVHFGNSLQDQAGLAMDAAGNTILVWADDANFEGEIRFQKLSAAGVLQGADYVVNTTTQGAQLCPSVALTGTSGFVVTWSGNGAGDNSGVFVQRYGTYAAKPQIGSFTAAPDGLGNVTLTAGALSDANPNSNITQVAFYLDSNGDGILEPDDLLLGYGTQNPDGTWTLTFSTAGWTPGSYTLFAQAEDNFGVFSDPLSLTLMVM